MSRPARHPAPERQFPATDFDLTPTFRAAYAGLKPAATKPKCVTTLLSLSTALMASFRTECCANFGLFYGYLTEYKGQTVVSFVFWPFFQSTLCFQQHRRLRSEKNNLLISLFRPWSVVLRPLSGEKRSRGFSSSIWHLTPCLGLLPSALCLILSAFRFLPTAFCLLQSPIRNLPSLRPKPPTSAPALRCSSFRVHRSSFIVPPFPRPRPQSAVGRIGLRASLSYSFRPVKRKTPHNVSAGNSLAEAKRPWPVEPGELSFQLVQFLGCRSVQPHPGSEPKSRKSVFGKG